MRVTLDLPEALVKNAVAQLEAAGSSLEEHIRLHLVTQTLAKKVLDLDDDIPFGKHRDETVEDVVNEDPHYIAWLMRVSDTVKFTTKVMRALEAVVEQKLSSKKLAKPKRKAGQSKASWRREQEAQEEREAINVLPF